MKSVRTADCLLHIFVIQRADGRAAAEWDVLAFGTCCGRIVVFNKAAIAEALRVSK